MKKVIGVVVLIIIVLVVVLLASGHTNAPKPSPSSPTPSPSPSATASVAPTPAATNTVTITNYAFTPANITVTKGTTVKWVNNDVVAHTVTETDGKTGPNSGDLNQNQSYSFTFDEVGTFKYNCSLHPYMTGTVTVTE
jgi:plastocyanin